MKKYILTIMFFIRVINLFSINIYDVSEVEVYENISSMYSDISSILNVDVDGAELYVDNHLLVIESINETKILQQNMVIIDWFPESYKYDVRLLTVEKDDDVYSVLLKKKDVLNHNISYLMNLISTIIDTEINIEKQYFTLFSSLRNRGIYYDPGKLWGTKRIYNEKKTISDFNQTYTLLGLYLLNKNQNREYSYIYLSKLLEHCNINNFLIDFTKYAGFDKYNFNTNRNEGTNKIYFNYSRNYIMMSLLEPQVSVDFNTVEDFYGDLSLFLKDRNKDIVNYNLSILSDINNIQYNKYFNKIKSDDLINKYKIASIDRILKQNVISSGNAILKEIVDLEVEILGEILKLEVENEI